MQSDGFFAAAARGDEDDDDRNDHDGHSATELCEAFTAGRIAGGGLLGSFAVSSGLLAALLASEVLLVAPHGAHGWNFYRFLIKNA